MTRMVMSQTRFKGRSSGIPAMMFNIILFNIFVMLLQVTSYQAIKHHKHKFKQYFYRTKQYPLYAAAEKRGAVALPDLKVVIGTKESSKEFKIGECIVKLSLVDKCKLTLQPSPTTCGGKVPFATILNHFLPKNGLAEKSKTFILPEKFDLKLLEINKCETTIDFKTSAREKLDLIPGKLSMEGVNLALKINYKTGAVDWELLSLDISGSITFAGKKIPITVKKNTKKTFVTFSFKTDQINVAGIVGVFSKKDVAPPNIEASAAKKVTSIVIKNPTFSGFYEPKGFFEVVASGEPQGASFKSSSFFVVIQKPEDDDVKAAVLAKIDMFSPAKFLTDLTGKDLTKIPLIKELVLNMAFAISNDDFVMIKNEDLTKAISGVIKGEKSIEKGMKMYMDVPIKDIFKKRAPDLKTDSFPASLFMKVSINKEGVKFNFPDDWKSDLLQILKGLAPKLKDHLPKWLQPSNGLPKVTIKDFSFDFKTMAFNIDVEIAGPLKLGNILSLYNIDLTVTSKGEDKPFDFSFSSSQTLVDDIILKTKLSKKGETYELEGSISMISTRQLIKGLGVKFLSEETLKKLDFLDFGMKDVKLKAKFGDTFYISISGTAILFGWDRVKFEGLVYVDGAASVMALGIAIEKIRLDEIVEKLFKKKLAGISWLTELNVVLTMSNTDANAETKNIQFENSNLQAVGIKKGIVFKAVASIPTDCKGDKLCELSKSVTQGKKKAPTFTLEGQITLTGAEFRAAYEGQLSLGKNAKLSKIELVLKIGKETKIYFGVTVDIANPKLQLGGTIGIGATGALELSATMTGIWENAFHIKYLAFGNIAFSIGFIPGVAVTEFAIEGELLLGYSNAVEGKQQKEAASKRITSKAAVGLHIVNPKNNYFYAEINEFTLGAIIEAFDFNVKLPKALEKTGFPDGVMVSFSPAKKELKQLKKTLESGLRFQGKISILGYELYVDCTITPEPLKFALMVEMSPIKIGGGAIALQRSKSVSDKGPILNAVISSSDVSINIEAFVTVLGISVGTRIDVSDKGFEFEISGSLFDVVSAELKIKAEYTDIKTASFQVSACLKTGADQIQKEVQETTKEAIEEAQNALAEANKQITSINLLYLKTKEGVSKLDEEIKKFQEKMRKKGKDVDEAKKILNEKCINECPEECIAAPDWNPKCFEVDGIAIGCFVWNECKLKLPNEACISKCKGEKLASKLKAAAKQCALQLFFKGYEGIKKLFNLGKKFKKNAVELSSKAKELFEKAKNELKPVLESMKTAAKEKIKDVVNIHSICFEASLSEAAKACVSFSFKATFFKTKKVDFDAKACLDLSFAKTIAKVIAEKLHPGFSTIKEKIKEIKSKLGGLEKEKDAVENTADEANKACENDAPDCPNTVARDFIWTEEEYYYKKLAYEQLPRFTIRDDETLDAFQRYAPSLMVARDDPMKKAIIEAHNNYKSNAMKKDNIKEDEGSCGQFSRRMKAVEGIVTGMKSLVESQNELNERMKTSVQERKDDIERVGLAIQSDCHEYGCDSENLDDAMFFANKAKEEVDKWAGAVKSQVTLQDAKTFSIWKRQMNSHIKYNEGETISQYVRSFKSTGESLHVRMGIPRNSEKMELLRKFSESLIELLEGNMSLTEATPAIETLAYEVAQVKRLNDACENRDVMN